MSSGEASTTAYRFLHRLFGVYGDPPPASARVELRCFSRAAWRPLQCWFEITDAGLRAAADRAVALAPDHDMYCTVLPRREHEGGASGIRVCRWLWVDIDGGEQGPEGSAELLRNSVRKLSLPEPAMIVMSGGGLHAYWALSTVVPCRTPEEQERVRNTLRRLVRAIGSNGTDDGVAYADRASAEPARILRVPGTFNHKRETPRPVRLLRCCSADAGTDSGQSLARTGARPLVWWRAHLPAEPLPVMARRASAETHGNRIYDTPPPKVREKLAGVPDGTKHRSMVEVAVWARKEGKSEEEIRSYAAQVARASGVNLGDRYQQRHLEDIVSYVLTNVQPAPDTAASAAAAAAQSSI